MKIGDIVKATRDIWQEADDGYPAMLLASRCDTLQVRRIGHGTTWPIHVGHAHREPEAMFGATLDEVTPCQR